MLRVNIIIKNKKKKKNCNKMLDITVKQMAKITQ